MARKKKLEIKEKLTELKISDLLGSLDHVIENLEHIRATYDGVYSDISIEEPIVDRKVIDFAGFTVYGKRKETDVEALERQINEKIGKEKNGNT